MKKKSNKTAKTHSIIDTDSSNNTSKKYNSTYAEPKGCCNIVIVQNEEKFPPPRLCLVRHWPNFEGGLGFTIDEDLISQKGMLRTQKKNNNFSFKNSNQRTLTLLIEK